MPSSVYKRKSELEETFAFHINAHGLPEPEREFKFHDIRRWRFDFAWPDLMIAVECEGGTWINGRHNRGSSFEKDCEKYSTAAEYGWRVFRYTADQIKKGEAVAQIERVLNSECG